MTNSAYHLLLVDDDSLIAESLRMILPKNWRMTCARSIGDINPRIMYHGAFVDMHLSGHSQRADGPLVIEKLVTDNPQIEVVGMSGDLSLPLMERCLASGARRFLGKPLSSDEVLSILEKIEALWMIRSLETKGTGSTQRWVGNSNVSTKIKNQIAELRGENGPILIEGESGTGKEVVARLLNTQEMGRPLVSVNIAGIPETLFESELFGHVKGAFTGADSMKIGLCEAAHGGDLFLDEIEAMPLTQQVKLLRFLETGEVRKVGAKESNHVKTRVIVATNQKLEDLVAKGLFREDLLWRISGKKIHLPALRERKEDINELALHFIDRERPRHNKNFATDALQALQGYNWPGNIRELKRICEQLCLNAPLPIIRREDVLKLVGPVDSIEGATVAAPTTMAFDLGLDAILEDYEKRVLLAALEKFNDVDAMVAALKVSRSTLYNKMSKYGIKAGSK